jgi:D-tyrosyl-tRNA(Tyr) deacylase
MKVLVQRVSSASVVVNSNTIGSIGNGLLLLVGIAEADSDVQLNWVADKCINLRVFEDEEGKMNRSLLDIHGEILAVSQFTLLADTQKGRRPSYLKAANPDKGEKLYMQFIEKLKDANLKVETGIFGAMMNVSLVNRGPVTLMIEKE